MITQHEREAIPGMVAKYKTLEPTSRKMTLEKCAHMAMKHPVKDTRELNALLLPELEKAERELTPAKPAPEKRTAEPITPAEFRALSLAIVKPIALFSGIGYGLYILGAAAVAIAESTRMFFLAYGWALFPAVVIIALLSAFIRSGGSPRNVPPIYRNEPCQNIHINIARDGDIKVER